MIKKLHSTVIIFIVIIVFSVSCGRNNSNLYSTSYTEKDTSENGMSFYTDEPIKIIYTSDYFWGAASVNSDAMTINYINLSELCKKELGFPVKFIKIDCPSDVYNAYALYMQSNQPADLIFPSKVIDPFNNSNRYWEDKYLDEGLYMDLSPYLDRFCPQAIINFNSFPYIKDNFVRNGKTYALYAGIPDISTIAILIRNEILEKTNIDIHNINNMNLLFDFMDDLYQGKEPPYETNKIWVSWWTLLSYAIYNSNYYTMDFCKDLVFDINDPYYKPYLIEDTDIIDYFFEKFSEFFNRSYFTTSLYSGLEKLDGKQDIVMVEWDPTRTKLYTRETMDEYDNIFNKYSIVLLNDHNTVINKFNTILPVMVPATSTQPEKALIFMQWLMTDKEAADILTFGSQLFSIKHYRYAIDGTIIPEKSNTIYGFYNLIANFSDKAFLFGNRDFNIIDEYKEMTFRAKYPYLYKIIDAQNNYFVEIQKFFMNEPFRTQNVTRHTYLRKTIEELILKLNQNSNMNAGLAQIGLYDVIDPVKYREALIDAIHKIIG